MFYPIKLQLISISVTKKLAKEASIEDCNSTSASGATFGSLEQLKKKKLDASKNVKQKIFFFMLILV